ncbi:MAG: hypothetical protein JWP34_4899 [Massilia sp.]|jgi:hypothetical protein|nr:hypothetical protein [Massilia sp.]
MVHVQTITEPGDTRCDLVELNTLLASIYKLVSFRTRLSGEDEHTHLAFGQTW